MSFAPTGRGPYFVNLPTACAVGCDLGPLRGSVDVSAEATLERGQRKGPALANWAFDLLPAFRGQECPRFTGTGKGARSTRDKVLMRSGA